MTTNRGAHTHRSNGRSHRHASRSAQEALTGQLTALQETAATAIEGAAQRLSDLKDKSIQTSKAMDQTIVKNPKSSVLIAFGVGYVLARLRKWI